MTTFTKEGFWAELEKLGEDNVRANLVTKVYGDLGPRHDLAQAWLEDKERSRISASSLEQIRIARSAKNAAWAAAMAAMIAIVISIASITISLLKH